MLTVVGGTFNIFQTHAIQPWTMVDLHHETNTIRLIIWPCAALSLHSPPLLPNPPLIQWITPVAASSGWINKSKPWMWLKGKQSLALNSDKRQGLAWQERKGYSLYTIVMATTYKRINGRWAALCLDVCAYVCRTYQSALSSTVTLRLASVSHTLAHKQSAKTKPSFTSEMYFKVFKVCLSSSSVNSGILFTTNMHRVYKDFTAKVLTGGSSTRVHGLAYLILFTFDEPSAGRQLTQHSVTQNEKEEMRAAEGAGKMLAQFWNCISCQSQKRTFSGNWKQRVKVFSSTSWL